MSGSSHSPLRQNLKPYCNVSVFASRLISVPLPATEYMSLLLDLYDRKPESALARLKDTAIDTFVSTNFFAPKDLLRCVCLSEMDQDGQKMIP